jgi:predicted HicB family RNase H-like nuclease
VSPELAHHCYTCYICPMPDNKSLNLRAVPSDLVRRAKSAAALQGVTLREWVLKSIEEKLKKGK